MQKVKKNREITRYILYAVVFMSIGFLFLKLTIAFKKYTPEGYEAITSLKAYILVITLFTIVGFLIILISKSAKKYSRHIIQERIWIKWVYYIIMTIFLLAVNYIFSWLVEFFVQAEDYSLFPNNGHQTALIMWVIEMVMMGLLLLDNSTHQSLLMHQKMAALQDEYNKVRYESLQAQVNPHFLFNNLNTLIAEITVNPKSAIEFTYQLSDVYRYVLQNQQQRLVSLRSELEFIESYLFLHKVRIGDCISLCCNMSEQDKYELKCPPLTLQLLVENVMKHNIVNLDSKAVIKIEKDKDYIVVSNTLNPRTTLHPSGRGLVNLLNRYKLICDREIVIEKRIEENIFVVKLPILYE